MPRATTKYETHVQPYLKNIEWWCREGLTTRQIEKRLKCSKGSIQRYKMLYKELRDAMATGYADANSKVEESLFRKAMGFEYDEVVTEKEKGKRRGVDFELVTTKTIHKTIPPDTVACIFWLKNRAADKWQDRRDVRVEKQLTQLNYNIDRPRKKRPLKVVDGGKK